MHGQGKMRWSNNCSYAGGYHCDLKHGEGVYQWADGRMYSGQWRKGKLHGRGTMSDAQGKCRHGEWRDGVQLGVDVKGSTGTVIPSIASRASPDKPRSPVCLRA
jgi:hypothetical protein